MEPRGEHGGTGWGAGGEEGGWGPVESVVEHEGEPGEKRADDQEEGEESGGAESLEWREARRRIRKRIGRCEPGGIRWWGQSGEPRQT